MGQIASPTEIEMESRPSSVSSQRAVSMRQVGSHPPSRAVPTWQQGKSSDVPVQLQYNVPLAMVIVDVITTLNHQLSFRNDLAHLLQH